MSLKDSSELKNRDWLEKQESIQRMLNSISARRGGGISESTKTTFLIFIEKFCNFTGKTPDELIAERMKDWKSDDIFTKRRHEELVTKFAQHLRQEGYAATSVSTTIGAVRSLYRSNYHPLIEVNIPSGNPVRVYKIPTKEELAQAVEYAGRTGSPWLRTYLIIGKDCGISLQDLLALRFDDGSPTYGTIKQQLVKGQCPIHINIVRKKTLLNFDTFLGQDSFEALQDNPPRIAKALKNDRNIFDYADASIQIFMKKLGKRLRWDAAFTPYSLRKWFRTQLSLDGVNEGLIEYMMGHSLGRVRTAYLIPPPQALMKIYAEHYDTGLKIDLRKGGK
jgi:integrase